MFTKLDKEIIDLLCCPICKGSLEKKSDRFLCKECATEYPVKTFSVGDWDEQVYDFRVQYPSFCVPDSVKKWGELQKEYENFSKYYSTIDELQPYLNEIKSISNIYMKEYQIQGSVLDVGGHQGRLRHFLSEDDVPLYISVDPYWKVFEFIQQKPNLLQAYPSLINPCNFLSCRAEKLPFIVNSFDWVHMRSVIDHFEDPYLALIEAYRVLKPGGNLMIGLSIIEKMDKKNIRNFSAIVPKIKQEGILKVMKIGVGKILGIYHGSHMLHLGHDELLDLLATTGFRVGKEYWLEPPFEYALYLSGRAR